MAALTLYLVDGVDANGWQSLSESTQSAVNTTAGWVVGTGSTNHSELFANTERASSTFTGTTVPDGSLDTTNKDAFRSPNALSGSFPSANWVFQFAMRSPTQGGAADGRVRFRLFRADANGANAVEITAAHQQAGVASNVGSAADVNSSLTFNPGAFSISNQYLFIQIAWERTGAGGMSTTNMRFRTGSASTPTGTVLVTADFAADQTLTAGAPTVTVSAPTATAAAEIALVAGAPTITVSAPTATLSEGGDTLVCGAPAITFSAPTASLFAETTLVAGAPSITISAPTLALLAETSLLAGAPLVALSAPAVTILPGTVTLVLGAPSIVFSAPAALLITDGGGGGDDFAWSGLSGLRMGGCNPSLAHLILRI